MKQTVYTCDNPRCNAKEIGFPNRPPIGWYILAFAVTPDNGMQPLSWDTTHHFDKAVCMDAFMEPSINTAKEIKNGQTQSPTP
jgi:hypothetical protein